MALLRSSRLLPLSLLLLTIFVLVFALLGFFLRLLTNAKAWSHGDMQHAVTGGLLSLLCGALGLAMETFAQTPKMAWMAQANIFPPLFYALTGVVMINHAQPRVFQIVLHQYWGALLLLGAVLRALFMVPICLQNGAWQSDARSVVTETCVRIGLFVLGVVFILIGCVFAGSMKPLLLLAEVAFEADTTPYVMLLVCCGLAVLAYELCAIGLWQRMLSKRASLSRHDGAAYELVSLDAPADEDTMAASESAASEAEPLPV